MGSGDSQKDGVTEMLALKLMELPPVPVPSVSLGADNLKKSNKIWIIGVVTVICIIGVIAGIAKFTTSGQKILNRFFPSVERTLMLSEVIPHTTNFSDYVVTLPVSNVNTKSTVIPKNQLEWNIKATEDKALYVEDPYDGLYQAISKSPIYTVEYILKGEDMNSHLLRILRENTKDILIQYDPETKTFVLTNTRLLEIGDPKVESIHMIIDARDYRIQSFELASRERANMVAHDEIVLIKGSSNIMIKPVESLFGDFLQRESVFIRTLAGGSNDELWHQWEEKYFNCKRCVNIMGDADGDGLLNIHEFVFGTDPFVTDSNNNGKNDFEDLRSLSHPLLGTDLSESYGKSIQMFLYRQMGFPEPVDRKEYGAERSAAAKKELVVPTKAKRLEFEYSFLGDPSSGDYATIFINNELGAVLLPISEPGLRTASIGIEKYSGTTIEFTVVRNSYGEKEVPPNGFIAGNQQRFLE